MPPAWHKLPSFSPPNQFLSWPKHHPFPSPHFFCVLFSVIFLLPPNQSSSLSRQMRPCATQEVQPEVPLLLHTLWRHTSRRCKVCDAEWLHCISYVATLDSDVALAKFLWLRGCTLRSKPESCYSIHLSPRYANIWAAVCEGGQNIGSALNAWALSVLQLKKETCSLAEWELDQSIMHRPAPLIL